MARSSLSSVFSQKRIMGKCPSSDTCFFDGLEHRPCTCDRLLVTACARTHGDPIGRAPSLISAYTDVHRLVPPLLHLLQLLEIGARLSALNFVLVTAVAVWSSIFVLCSWNSSPSNFVARCSVFGMPVAETSAFITASFMMSLKHPFGIWCSVRMRACIAITRFGESVMKAATVTSGI